MVNKMKCNSKFWRLVFIQLVISALIISSVTFLSLVFQQLGFSEINIAVIYVLSVLVIARITKGYVYSLISSVVNILCFNYFFTEPYYTLNVYNKNYLTVFVVMLIASLLTSTLTSKILQTSATASKNEKLARMLYQITSSLAKASGITEVVKVSVRCISNLAGCDTTFIIFKENRPNYQKYSFITSENRIDVQTVSEKDIDKIVEGKYILPITNQLKKYGAICFDWKGMDSQADQDELLHSIGVQICVAMEREYLAEEKNRMQEQAEREKFKSNLLRAISHDLRTPLTGISGAAEILQYNLKDSENQKLAHGIYDDANWLTHMVENILSLTRIEEGKMIENVQPEAVEEVVADAVRRASKYSGDHRITVQIPDEVLFVPMNARLIIQVLINLIDNAVKHSPPDSEIHVKVNKEGYKVWFYVIDHGTGIPEEDLPHIFDLFYRAEHTHADSKRGMGLGLTICKSIVTAHSGAIFAENNPQGGTSLKFWLPYQGSMKIDG
jgi:Osmosensitive K+ channel histidine kinase